MSSQETDLSRLGAADYVEAPIGMDLVLITHTCSDPYHALGEVASSQPLQFSSIPSPSCQAHLLNFHA